MNAISDCDNFSEVTGKRYVGGIVGFSQTTNIQNCNNSGVVEATSDGAGGMIGYGGSCDISSCFNNGAIRGTNFVGGIGGWVRISKRFKLLYYRM